jgi:hypothetical protein
MQRTRLVWGAALFWACAPNSGSTSNSDAVDTNSDGIVEPPDPVIGPATGALAGDDGTEYVSGF